MILSLKCSLVLLFFNSQRWKFLKNLLKIVSTVLAIFFNVFCINICQASVEEADFLSNVAKQYMLAQFDNNRTDKKYLVKASKIDPNRDYGGKCSGFLTAELVGGEIKKSNVVRIKCTRKNNPYTVNVPVTVNVARATTIASANIPKGTTITADLLEDSFVNESSNTSAVITDKSMILGSKARRDIRAGEQIKVSDFCVIAKGDIVTIVASTNNLEIKTQGQALEEGKVNDLIQVKNVKTKKVIQAVVTGPNTVKVIF